MNSSPETDAKQEQSKKTLPEKAKDNEGNEETTEKGDKKDEEVTRSMLIDAFEERDWEKAEKISYQLLQQAEKTHTKQSKNYWQAMMEYAEIEKMLHKDKEALELYLSIEKLTDDLFGDNHTEVASVCNNIAMLYYHTFQHKKTLPYFQKALKIWERLYDENDEKVSITRGNIQANTMMAQLEDQMTTEGIITTTKNVCK
ncbi:kinesin light chain [Reticulomyxa filosa]|uniref:Kinesin light chain n=1 Tax=Reticulomyxa filosa TaxID=46433 RepID=X6MNZ8_RETFI|nr:kinesin light chain [Reticulomyxa filosa]|eukprot:ETO15361.1 kinesin light chain [Reticulomyxa filosa]